MKRIFIVGVFITFLFGLIVNPVFAKEIGFTLTPGLRKVDLKWNIAGDTNGQNPNVLSELTWDDLYARQIKGEVDIKFDNDFYIRASGAYGWIYEGDNQDSDYLGDDRTLEFSRSNNDGSGDDMIDASAAIGYAFSFIDTSVNKKATIIPLIGYSYHEQNLSMTDGMQTVTSVWAPPLGPIAGLDSSYKTEWEGPWAGVDLLLECSKRNTIVLRYEYHDVDYTGVGNWNLRTDFQYPKSFEHTADGKANLWGFEFRHSIGENQEVRFNYIWEKWETDAGLDRTFFSNGTIADTQLNEVIFESTTLGLSYNVHF